jgi:signal transduction histidine kinase
MAVIWDAEKRAGAAFALTLALIALLAVLSCGRTLELARLDARLADSYQTLAVLQEVLSTLQQAQTAERGYLLTGEDRFLEPYYRARARVPEGLGQLEALAADHPDDRGLAGLLAQQAASEVTTLERLIHLRQQQGFEAARQRVLRGGGGKMEALQGLAGELARLTNARLLRSAERSRAGMRAALLTLCLSCVTEVGLVGLCYGLVRRNLRQRRRVEESLRQAERRKDDFLATLAHELRNPLAPIRNALGILGLPGVGAAAVEQARQIMARQLQHLVGLVDDLLDVSRIARGKVLLRREPIRLAAVVERAVEEARPLILAQGHELVVTSAGEAAWVEGDVIRLTQVVANLLTNAARYTNSPGRIGLSVTSEGGEVLLRVRDNGMGIASEMLPHIFEPFVQGDGAAGRPQGGLGLGLALVKRLVEMHGGSVSAASAGSGAGSAFTVRLPASAPPTPPGEADSGPPSSKSPPG